VTIPVFFSGIADDPLTRQVHAQQVRLLYDQAPLGFIAGLLIAPMLTAMLWNVIPHPVLLIWLMLLETTLLIRLALTVAFRRCANADDEPTRWAICYTVACAASGCCWGGTLILFTLSPSVVYDAFIALVLGGVLMSGVLTMTPVPMTYRAYAMPLALPPLLWLLVQDDMMRATMGAAGLLYLLLVMAAAHRYHQTLTQSLRLALSNGELAQSFAAARQQAETHYRQLVAALAEEERISATAQRQQTLLAHASRLNTLGEMASGLVHEINQPMTAIGLYTEAGLAQVRSGEFEPAEIRETLEKIAAQSTRASAIIQKIRRFARQGSSQYAPVRIEALLNEIADFLNLEAQHYAIPIHYDVSSELPPVLADGLQVQQVILNLVRNAIDAMSDSQGAGLIAISAHANPDAVEIRVQDTGSGLHPDTVGQLLHPFFTTKPDGLGLGLSISQAIVEAHGGRLWAVPNTDRGVTFHFTLPLTHYAERAELANPVALPVATTEIPL